MRHETIAQSVVRRDVGRGGRPPRAHLPAVAFRLHWFPRLLPPSAQGSQALNARLAMTLRGPNSGCQHTLRRPISGVLHCALPVGLMRAAGWLMPSCSACAAGHVCGAPSSGGMTSLVASRSIPDAANCDAFPDSASFANASTAAHRRQQSPHIQRGHSSTTIGPSMRVGTRTCRTQETRCRSSASHCCLRSPSRLPSAAAKDNASQRALIPGVGTPAA